MAFISRRILKCSDKREREKQRECVCVRARLCEFEQRTEDPLQETERKEIDRNNIYIINGRDCNATTLAVHRNINLYGFIYPIYVFCWVYADCKTHSAYLSCSCMHTQAPTIKNMDLLSRTHTDTHAHAWHRTDSDGWRTRRRGGAHQMNAATRTAHSKRNARSRKKLKCLI